MKLFLLIFPRQTLKESVNKVVVNVSNQVSINIVSHIYHPPPTPPLKQMITQIRIVTYLVKFLVVPEIDAMVLIVINRWYGQINVVLLQGDTGIFVKDVKRHEILPERVKYNYG